ncbi:MAG: hypothetical protein WD231_05875 [Candidatus Woykebacteria bacterium]
MKYVVHGDDIVASRRYVSSLKKNYQNSYLLEGEKGSLEEIYQQLLNEPLFDEKTLVIVENYSGSDKIFEDTYPVDVVFWWSKTLSKVPRADKSFYFRDSNAFGIFKLADSIGEKKLGPSLLLLNKLFDERVPPEKIISILARQLKLINQVLYGDVERVSSSEFVKQKLKNQVKLWNLKKLQRAFLATFQVDLLIKAGKIKPQPALTFLTVKLCS